MENQIRMALDSASASMGCRCIHGMIDSRQQHFAINHSMVAEAASREEFKSKNRAKKIKGS